MTASEMTRTETTGAETTGAETTGAGTTGAGTTGVETTGVGTATPVPGGAGADVHRLVHQLVFRRDADDPSGGPGLALAAWSYEPERAEKILRVADRLRLAGPDAAPGLVRIVSQRSERVLLVRRVPAPGPGGRTSTVCHVLFGTDDSLGAESCLGLHRWDWPGGDLPLDEVRGGLEPVPADALRPSAALGLDALSSGLPQAGGPLSAAVAAVLRDPGGRHSFLDARGGDLPYLVLRGLHGVFGRLHAQQPFGWSFATHDTDDSERFQFVFVPRWPAEALHDVDRVRTDLEQPRDDCVLATAAELVRLHLETAGQADGRAGGAAAPVASALEQETAGIHDLRAAGDDLLRAAERVVRSLKSRVLTVTSDVPTADSDATDPAAPGPRPEPGLRREPEPGLRGVPEPGLQSGREQGREQGREGGLEEDHSVVFRSSTDDYLLYALRDDLPEAQTALLLREIRRRIPRWPLARRAELGVLALDRLLADTAAPVRPYSPPPPSDAAPEAPTFPPPDDGDASPEPDGDNQARIVVGCAVAVALILTVLSLLVWALWQG